MMLSKNVIGNWHNRNNTGTFAPIIINITIGNKMNTTFYYSVI